MIRCFRPSFGAGWASIYDVLNLGARLRARRTDDPARLTSLSDIETSTEPSSSLIASDLAGTIVSAAGSWNLTTGSVVLGLGEDSDTGLLGRKAAPGLTVGDGEGESV